MDLVQHGPALVVLATVGLVFIGFLTERYSPDAVVLAGVAVLLVTGILPAKELLAVFSNSAPITVAAMFVLSGALMRTGAIESAAETIAGLARRAPHLALAAVVLLVILLSAFINNTPVVIVLIPVVIKLATAIGQAPSRFLIPLSYAAILGGTCTLIGTSTNLLVDGVARAQGLAPFGMFEITPAGLVVALVGLLALVGLGPRLLPNRQTVTGILEAQARPRYLTEVVIPDGSPLIGSAPEASPIFTRHQRRLVDVLRGDESLRRDLGAVRLQAGDRVVIKTPVQEVMALREETRVAPTFCGSACP